MYTLFADLKFAVRNLSRSPGFVAVSIVTLALGIGLNSAIFSVVNWVLFRPLPYDAPGEVVTLNRPDPEDGSNRNWSYPHFEDYRAEADQFAYMVAWSSTRMSMGRGEAAAMMYGELVPGDYFESLGAEPLLGRFFTIDDDLVPLESPVTVVSESYWRTRLNGDPNVIGQPLAINGNEFTIVAVTRPGFGGMQEYSQTQFWVPMMMEPVIEPARNALNVDPMVALRQE